jgi:hypothetical protein
VNVRRLLASPRRISPPFRISTLPSPSQVTTNSEPMSERSLLVLNRKSMLA